MGGLIDLTDQRFGRLVVTSRAENSSSGRVRWSCVCDCGKEHSVRSGDLRSGDTTSCGCYREETRYYIRVTHGRSDRNRCAEYSIWGGMKTRCYNSREKCYPNYGGRGITVCDEWRDSFERFFEDMGPRPSIDHSIDRIDNNQGYSKENCRWATAKVQARNQRKCRPARLISPDGIRHIVKQGCVREFCKKNDLAQGVISAVLRGDKRQYKRWTGKYL